MKCKGNLCINYFSKPYRWQFGAGFVATLGCLSAGNVLGWTAAILPSMLAELMSFGLFLTPSQISWIGSIPFIAAFFCTFPLRLLLVDRLGPKRSLMLLTLPMALGCCLIAFSQNFAMLLAGRFFTGLSGGPLLAIIPQYIAEIAEPIIHSRLKVIMLSHFAVGAFMMLVHSIFYSWLKNTLIAGLLPLQMLIILYFMPESPKYNTRKSHMDKAMDGLKKLRGKDEIQEIVPEFKEILKGVEEAKANDPGLGGLTNSMNLRILAISSLLLFLLLWTGIVVLTLFPLNLLTMVKGSDPKNPFISMFVLGFALVLATNLMRIARGANKAMIGGISLTLMAFSTLGTAVLLSYAMTTTPLVPPMGNLTSPPPQEAPKVTNGDWILLGLQIVYLASFCVVIPIPWSLINGLPLHISTKRHNSTLLLSVACLAVFLVAQSFDELKKTLGFDNYWWVCGGSSILATLLGLYILYTEKKAQISIRNPPTEQPSNGEINRAFETDLTPV